MTCMGPIIRAGCDSRCPNSGEGCDGCRGPVDDPNINAEKDLLVSKPGESHPELLLEPGVKVSLHPAPVIYAVGLRIICQ